MTITRMSILGSCLAFDAREGGAVGCRERDLDLDDLRRGCVGGGFGRERDCVGLEFVLGNGVVVGRLFVADDGGEDDDIFGSRLTGRTIGRSLVRVSAPRIRPLEGVSRPFRRVSGSSLMPVKLHVRLYISMALAAVCSYQQLYQTIVHHTNP